MNSKSAKRVVITGMGAVTALGSTLGKTWEGVLAGKSGIRDIVSFDVAQLPVRFAGDCRDFNPTEWFAPKDIKRLSRSSALAVCATKQAIEDAQLNLEHLNRHRAGVVIGSSMSGLELIEDQCRQCLSTGRRVVPPFFIPQVMPSAPAAQISILFGFKGPSFSISSACASANNAMATAFSLIRAGISDIMVTGGAEAPLTFTILAGFCALRVLSTRNGNPGEASRPFDKDRDGFVLSEGSAILIFEEMEHACKRGALIYAEVLGASQTAEAFHITQPRPGGIGMADCMSLCLQNGSIALERVRYINAHGTATPTNDREETMAIKKVFGAHAKHLAISSTKSMLGHSLGAAGAIELAITVLAVKQQLAPPTINHVTPDPECDLDYIPNEARYLEIDVALSNSMGFGGHNSTIAIGRYG